MKKKVLSFLNRPAEGQSVLPHAKRRNGRVSVEIEVVEVPRIEHGVSESNRKQAAVPVVRARLGDHVDLAASLSAVLRVVRARC